MKIPEDTLLALKEYLDAKIEHEVAWLSPASDGYSVNLSSGKKKVEDLWNKVLTTNLRHDKEYNYGWKS